MHKRKALLIGVPKYDSASIPDLHPVVESDIELVSEAVRSSGYEVRTLGITQAATGTRIRKDLSRFFKEASRGDTLLVHFTGHGVHYRGKDYLVPFDGDLEHDQLQDFLVPVDFDATLQESAADTVIFFIDACREGIELTTKSIDQKGLTLKKWGRGQLNKSKRKEFAVVYSCSPGEVSRFVPGDSPFSLFSRAFSDVFGSSHSATTLQQVYVETQLRLNELCDTHHKARQTVRLRTETDIQQRVLTRAICEGPHELVSDELKSLTAVDNGRPLKHHPKHLVIAAAENWSVLYDYAIERVLGAEDNDTVIMRSLLRRFVAGDYDAARLVKEVCDQCQRETGTRTRGSQIVGSAFNQFVKQIVDETDEVKTARSLLNKRITQTLKLAENIKGLVLAE